MNRRVVVLGADGQVGRMLQKHAGDFPHLAFIFAGRDLIDITAPQGGELLREMAPDFVINCAAYTAVDRAEHDEAACFAINRDAVANLCQWCIDCDAVLVHLSSDYVYHIRRHGPLLETDDNHPRGVYARSKFEGEKIIVERLVKHIIIRTSWVYSEFGGNFVKTMLKLAENHERLQIVADQYGSPTYAGDLAHAIGRIVSSIDPTDTQFFGTYNYSNEGITNWADFARTIFQKRNKQVLVEEVSTQVYGAAAPRPLWSVMSKQKIRRAFNLDMAHWIWSLDVCLANLNKNTAEI